MFILLFTIYNPIVKGLYGSIALSLNKILFNQDYLDCGKQCLLKSFNGRIFVKLAGLSYINPVRIFVAQAGEVMAKRVVQSSKPQLTGPLGSKQLGAFVRYRRTSEGITLQDAAALCGLSKQAYSNVEKGVATVRLDTVLKVLAALGIALRIDEPEVGDDWL